MKAIYSILVLSLISCLSLSAFAQREIDTNLASVSGRVVDTSGMGIAFANVIVKKDGAVITGAQTDFDGMFRLDSLDSAKCELKISSLGYFAIRVSSIILDSTHIFLDTIALTRNPRQSQPVERISITLRLIDHSPGPTQTTFTAEEIRRMPVSR